jgi:hypothetical protein
MRTTAHARPYLGALTAALLAASATAAGAQSPVIALRTNGSIMRPGECLRLEALALDELSGPLAAEVTYRYDKAVVEKDKDGAETARHEAVEIRRPAGPTLDVLARLQLYLLDDTFCFGQGAPPGRYDVEVALRSGRNGAPAARLRTCVVFDDADAPSAPPGAPGCGFLVSGVKRTETDATMVLDANLPESGFYRGAILRGANVEAVLEAGIYPTGEHELTVLLPALERRPAGTFDLVVVEQFGASSSTLSRLPIPPR